MILIAQGNKTKPNNETSDEESDNFDTDYDVSDVSMLEEQDDDEEIVIANECNSEEQIEKDPILNRLQATWSNLSLPT